MKRFLLISGLAFLFMHVIAQHDKMIPTSQLDEQKKDILKEANEIKNLLNSKKTEYVLDSIIYYQFINEYDSILHSKTEYIYFGTEEYHRIKYVWDDVSGSWVNAEKNIWIFDENENLLEYWRINWNESSNEWVNDIKIVSEYNIQGQETLYVYYKGDEISGEWKNYIKEEYTYDGNGNMTLDYLWMWDEDLNDWLGSFYAEMVYNNLNLLTERTGYFWDTSINDWSESYKSEYEYDNNDYLIVRKEYNWSMFLNSWSLDYKSEYTYNSSGNPELIMSYYSLDNGLTWMNNHKTEKTYNADNQEILSVSYSWEDNTQEWIYSSKFELNWDEFGNRSMEKRYIWEIELNEWQLMNDSERSYFDEFTMQSIEVYSYNYVLEQLTGDYRFLYEVNSDIKYTIRHEWVWDVELSQWIFDTKGFYYYTTFTNIENLNDTRFEIYPNPVINELTLKQENPEPVIYSIYSLNGSLLLDGNTSGQIKNINVGNIPKGIYIISIDDGKAIYSRSFVKE